ncbi:hypothetical protein DAEQUDRAFT_440564 [Daedalea quercina L-15889]|uniref:Stress response protein NST1 n=1 Tax=Daedalea quercina L-15889 TaxID=1314783 RepID=A0A165NC22_9APHY|nr:hypothetical protein DAEQUDRAFT_440564 [Daedalea quercina L-15889]
MAAGKAKKAAVPVSRPTVVPAPPAAPAPVASPPPAPTTNGKKKKKKKGKGKSLEIDPAFQGMVFEDRIYDEDEMPEDIQAQLANVVYADPETRSASRTGLSPELESVRLSSASLAAVARQTPGMVTEADLAATVNHLTRGMEPDAEGRFDEEYLEQLPDHIRSFVRNTYLHLSAYGDADEKTQAMYAIAQQIHAGTGGAKSSQNGARYAAGAFPTSARFDPAMFSDPAFSLAMEQAAAANGLHPLGEGDPTNVVLLDEYAGEEGYAEDEYYSDDDLDEFDDVGEEIRRASLYAHDAPPSGGGGGGGGGLGPGYTPGRKKKQKKKKKQPQRPATAEEAGRERPETPSVAAVGNSPPPVSAPNPMPTARPPPSSNPPPSSRAAGKQPMSYAPPAPAANPPPSRRAASKAPITSHAYQHNHTHHHPSPPSSNASAPHKPRPPANGTGGGGTVKNNKIWSTSTTEERERIKEFWLGLGEEERRNLVKIEKDAVLKKMKEQQKHSCSCAVCGRKRSAIEEELEVLYDAYYEELEQYANYQQRYISSGCTLPPPQGPGPFPGSVELDGNGTVIDPHGPARPATRPKGAIMTNGGRKPVKPPESEFDDDGEEDEYEEEEYDDEEDEEEEEEDEDEDEADAEDEDDVKPQPDRRAAPRRRAIPNGTKAHSRDGLGNFGNNLTVTGE